MTFHELWSKVRYSRRRFGKSHNLNDMLAAIRVYRRQLNRHFR
jgi:hypothetical protein